MTTPEVWAPQARRVESLTDGTRKQLAPRGDGWWHAEEPLEHGESYAFSLDAGRPLPDPRSRWQPDGVHGASRALDHAAFEWSDRSWRGIAREDLILYELHVGTFTPFGTFAAIEDKLDHLLDLGITAVELMPIAEFPGSRGWGYDGVDLYAPHHSYGEPGDLKRFVDRCHARGLAVIIDVVYNHLGPDGNYLAEFGPYFTDRYGTPWGSAVNLDGPDSEPVRDFFIENALMWMRDYHFDGIRLDAVHAIFDASAVHFLEELKARAEELERILDRRLLVIAESDLNDPRVVLPRARGGYGLDAQWSDDFHHALHAVITGERTGYYADFGAIGQIAKALQHAFVYDGVYSAYRRRRHGRSTEGLTGHAFLGYIQNHDQVGNRALGERLTALVSGDLGKVAAALVLTSPFIPLIFQGEEWGATSPFNYFTDHNRELGAAVSRGRKREFAAFGWPEEQIPDPQDEATFVRSKLNWSELEDPIHADLFEWYRRLITLRKSVPELCDGRMDLVRTEIDEVARWLLVRRGSITLACNFSEHDVVVPVRADERRTEVLTSALKPPESVT
ncbi:MAG TPA: malto-oligosyltrehalose trehalohydrolase, partial [Actinomycetota bacterium]|nr:malto-oligosyltrehalose trehalohydrolase [Actinomycetota bacterium]